MDIDIIIKVSELAGKIYIAPLPKWLMNLSIKMLKAGVFKVLPNQVIVNEYLPGQGISQHIDCISCFRDIICSLTLGSPCIMEFIKDDLKAEILLETRSLLILTLDARYIWTHNIPARKYYYYDNTKILRGRRVSLTFRTTEF